MPGVLEEIVVFGGVNFGASQLYTQELVELSTIVTVLMDGTDRQTY